MAFQAVVTRAYGVPRQMAGMPTWVRVPASRARDRTFGALPAPGGLLDNLTGGEYSNVRGQLSRLENLLTISIVASCVAGAAGLVALLRSGR